MAPVSVEWHSLYSVVVTLYIFSLTVLKYDFKVVALCTSYFADADSSY